MGQVENRLRKRIRDQGPLSFSKVMEEALYGSGGYYARSRLPIAPDGDYLTASVLPLMARVTLEYLRRLDEALGHQATFWELGYGNAEHLGFLKGRDPDRVYWGGDRIERGLPEEVIFRNLDSVPDGSFSGLLFSYELFDAFPVNRYRQTARGLRELRVGLDGNDQLVFVPNRTEFDASEHWGGVALEEGQVADWTSSWGLYYDRMAAKVSKGILVTIDYGYERDKLFDSRVRFEGSLASYRHHRGHRRFLEDLGQNDLTAHIDWTSLIEAGEARGLKTLGFMRQAQWLAQGGIFAELATAGLRQKTEAMALLDPQGMGHDLRVLVQGIGVEKDAIFPSFSA